MSIPQEDLVIFLNIIGDKNNSLELICDKFYQTFSVENRFACCTLLVTFLQDGLLLPDQRLSTFWLLYSSSRASDVSVAEGLVQLFVEALHATNGNLERLLCSHLLSNIGFFDESCKLTIDQLANSLILLEGKGNEIDTQRLIDLLKGSCFSNLLHECSSYNSYELSGIRPILPFSTEVSDRESKKFFFSELDIAAELELYCEIEMAMQEPFLPVFMCSPPPLLGFEEGEIKFLDGNDSGSLIWEPMESAESASRENMIQMMESAVRSPMSPKQQQHLVQLIKSDQLFHVDCPLYPSQLPKLIENNSQVAVECLIKIVGHQNEGFRTTDYLLSLLEMDISFHSIEVINGLSAVIDLPPQFLNSYITNCISSCENMKDKFVQSRFVRLICVLLQSLIRKNVANVRGLFIEIQAFCLSFSKVKEAVLLYQLIKTMETSGM